MTAGKFNPVPSSRSRPSGMPRGREGWHHDGVDYLLAQVNIARMREPLDSPLLAEFVAALDPVNAAADATPGFIWRRQTEDGNATAVHAFEWAASGSSGWRRPRPRCGGYRAVIPRRPMRPRSG